MRILDLLAAASKLKTLRLVWNIDQVAGDPELEHRAHRLSWILDVSPNFAPPLEHMTLGGMIITPDHLFRLLAACRDTLSSMSLYDVGLDQGAWTYVLDFLRGGSFGRLRRLALHDVHEAYSGIYIAFRPLWHARGQIPELRGGTFEFGTINPTILAGKKKHVRGIIFEAEGGRPSMKAGLQVIAEYSHLERNGEGRGRHTGERGTEMWRQHIEDIFPEARIEAFKRWTGFP